MDIFKSQKVTINKDTTITFKRLPDEDILLNNQKYKAFKLGLTIYQKSKHKDHIFLITNDFHYAVKVKMKTGKLSSDGIDLTSNKDFKIKSLEDFIELFSKPGNFFKSHLQESSEYVSETPNIFLLVNLLFMAPAIFLFGVYLFKKVKFNMEKRDAEIADDTIAQKLFENHKPDDPIFLKHYAPLIHSVNDLITGKRIFLLISGDPGAGKTHIIRRQFHLNNKKSGKDYHILKGSAASIIAIVQSLYDMRHPGKVVIFDDFDTPLQNQDTVNILKSATDTYQQRIISFAFEREADTHSATMYDFPEKFKFEGKIIIVTNLAPKQIDLALVSRAGGVINIEFNQNQLITLIKDMLPYIEPKIDLQVKQEVYNFMVSESKKHKQNISMRTFRLLLDIRMMHLNDQQWYKYASVIY